MKRLLIILPLILLISCDDNNEETPFTIIGTWQFTHQLKSSGEWESFSNGYKWDFKISGNVTYSYFENDEWIDMELPYSFDELTMALEITRTSTSI